MNTNSAIRITFATAVALALTTAMFAQLYRLTQVSFVYTPTKTILIQPKRVAAQETPPTIQKEYVKPVREILLPGTGPVVITREPTDTTIRDSGYAGGSYQLEKNVVEPLVIGGNTDHDTNPLVRISPTYPASAQTRGIEGWVQVRYNISTGGAVTDVVVVASEPSGIFEKATVSAVAGWRYSPKIVNGAAVERVGLETVLRFELPKN